MKRRDVLGLATAAAIAGCSGWPGDGADRTADGPSIGRSTGTSRSVGPIDVQASILGGAGPFDVRSASGAAYVRVPVVLEDRQGRAIAAPDPYLRLRDGLSLALDDRVLRGPRFDRASQGPGRVLAFAVPAGSYEQGVVRVEPGERDTVRRSLPRDRLADLADPPAFEVTRFAVSDPIEQQFLVATTTVANVGGAAGRFLAVLGRPTGSPRTRLSVDVPAGESATQVTGLPVYRRPDGPVSIRLAWGSGSAERTVRFPGV